MKGLTMNRQRILLATLAIILTTACRTGLAPVGSLAERQRRIDPLAALRVMNTPNDLEGIEDEQGIASKMRLALSESGTLPIRSAPVRQGSRVRRLGRQVLREWPMPLRVSRA